MNLTHAEILANAYDWIGTSQDLEAGEMVDREQLAGQMQYTSADADDIEAIAQKIEQIIA